MPTSSHCCWKTEIICCAKPNTLQVPLIHNFINQKLNSLFVSSVIILALSVRYERGICHFMINQEQDGSFYLETHHEKSVTELISWHQKTQTPVSVSTSAKLKKPIERPVSLHFV
jgi:hypothetical protein